MGQDFAQVTAKGQEIAGALTDQHWKIIRYIHTVFREEGRCPMVFQTCKANGLRLKQFAELFPTGYLRGACRIAGITYREGYHGYGCVPSSSRQFGKPAALAGPQQDIVPIATKTYTIDVYGFLVDPGSWDERYAAMRAADLKMPPLSDRHWEILRYVRRTFDTRGVVPTVIDTCQANRLEIEDLERLFPDGYHRGLIKLAGLRVL